MMHRTRLNPNSFHTVFQAQPHRGPALLDEQRHSQFTEYRGCTDRDLSLYDYGGILRSRCLGLRDLSVLQRERREVRLPVVPVLVLLAF